MKTTQTHQESKTGPAEPAEHVQVIATITRHGELVDRIEAGSYPAWALPLDAEWKKARRDGVLEYVGHYPQRGDGWRVAFTLADNGYSEAEPVNPMAEATA